MISPGVFFIFLKFWFFWAVRVVKGLKIAQNELWKLHLTRAISQEQCNIWSWFLVLLCKMMISPAFYFHCFEIFIFWAVRVVKGKSIAQNEWQLHLSRATSLEQYSGWSWFLLHLCKMMISPGVFFIFDMFIFRAVRGVKGQKWPKMTK